MWALIKWGAEWLWSWLRHKQQVKEAQYKTELAIQENKTRLALDENKYNHMWEMEALKNSGKALKWMSFTLFALPFLIAWIAPEYIHHYFVIIKESIPRFWQDAWITINGSIWGVMALKKYFK